MESVVETRLEMDYPQALLRIWRMTDSNSIRYSLGFVKLDFQRFFVEATTGRILVREQIELHESFWNLEPVLLHGATLKRIARMFALGKLPGLKLVNIGQDWFAENADIRLRIPTDDGRFPDTNPIYAIKPERVAKFNVDMKELRRFLAAFESLDQGVEVSIPLDGTGPAILSCGCGSVDARLSLMTETGSGRNVKIEPEAESP